jgi:hypothetical protein
MEKIKQALFWLWQAPQHLLALAIWKALTFHVISVAEIDEHTIITIKPRIGLSLGRYIFICSSYGETTIKHEKGHTLQSHLLGPLYLLVIGLPSLCGNIYDRIKHKGSTWYYKQPWEAWADRLGGVERG